MSIARELTALAEWLNERGDSFCVTAVELHAKASEVRAIVAKVEGRVLVKPEVFEHQKGYLTGKTHFVARCGATGNFYGKTADEALANLRAAAEPTPTTER